MNPNRDIIYYTDYRKFLRDYYSAKKKQVKGFTYQVFADQAEFSAVSFLKMVIDGKKNLTEESVGKVARALKLKKKSAEYFKNIVFFTQVKSIAEKKRYLGRIDRYRKQNKPELLLAGEYDYLRNWLHVVVRETVELHDFDENPVQIAKKLRYGVKPDEIKKSLTFLIEHGFLKRDKKGRLVKRDKTLSNGTIPHDEELELIARSYHLKMIELAGKAVSELPKELRHVINGTLSMSRENYDIACKRIGTLFYELLELAGSDEGADEIFQLNINLFPMSRGSDEG